MNFSKKKMRRELDATVVCIDQTKTSVNGPPTIARFQRNSQPSEELWGLRAWTRLLGAVTDDGRSLFSRFPETVTGEHARHFILALYLNSKIICSLFSTVRPIFGRLWRISLIVMASNLFNYRSTALTLIRRGVLETARISPW